MKRKRNKFHRDLMEKRLFKEEDNFIPNELLKMLDRSISDSLNGHVSEINAHERLAELEDAKKRFREGKQNDII